MTPPPMTTTFGFAARAMKEALGILEPLLVDEAFEDLHQVGGGDDLDAAPAHQLDDTGVHHRDVGDVVERGIVHGDAWRRGEQPCDLGMQLSPGQVVVLVAGQLVQLAADDLPAPPPNPDIDLIKD